MEPALKVALSTIALPFIAILLCCSVTAPTSAQEQSGEVDVTAIAAMEPMTGDLDAIVQRGTLRMAIPYTPIYFSYDGEKLIGFAVEIAREMEAFLREKLGARIDVVLMPLPRDQILPAVIEGMADVAVANLMVTEARSQIVDFADPIFTGVSEFVVTGPAAAHVQSMDDLVSTGVYLRPSSSRYEHLQELNKTRGSEGKPPIPIVDADPHLEDYDLLDMLNIGVLPAVAVDSRKLQLWRKVFVNLVIHENLVLHEDGEIAWAIRKSSPQLMETMNGFVSKVRKGTLLGNILADRYLGSSEWINEIKRGHVLEDYNLITKQIRKRADEYGFDWRLILAQPYQESKLDQNKKSAVGALGIMQILPSTAKDPNVALPEIDRQDVNIHAGVKYLRFLKGRYFDTPEISEEDAIFFSLAAYNAGAGNVSKARKRAKKMGLDPNRWFSNVEMAMARTVGREPVIYVRNIHKYFVSFSLQEQRSEWRARAAAVDAKPITPKVIAGTTDWTAIIAAALGVSAALIGGVALWRRFV